MSNILLHYADQGLSGAARCASAFPTEVCPPVTYGSRAKWTAQAHEVKGPIGLLCTSLAEHRAAITSEMKVYGWPRFAFNLGHVAKQQLRKRVDTIITAAHFQFLPKNRTALAAMPSLD